jgi:hypothetical protein
MSPPGSIGVAIRFFQRATQTLECIQRARYANRRLAFPTDWRRWVARQR